MALRYFRLSVFLILALSVFISCKKDGEDDDMIWDIYPIVVTIQVQDAEGNDLLNPDAGWLGKEVILKRGDETYTMVDLPHVQKTSSEEVTTRYYMARFYGMRRYRLSDYYPDADDVYVVNLGELFGDKDYQKETMVIDWGNGEKDTIQVDNKFRWKKKQPDIKRTIYCNGVAQEGSVIILKK